MLITKIVLFSLLFAIVISGDSSSKKTTCEVQDELYSSKSESIYLEKPIQDVFRGEIAKIKTKNVLRIKFSVDYIDAKFENQVITLSTNENFTNYEKQSKKTEKPKIEIYMSMDCTQDGYASKYLIQEVQDTNNHYPEFSRKSYYYGFGMTIPKDLILTNIVPLEATDIDITNMEIKMEMTENDDFELVRTSKKEKSDSKYKYVYDLVARKEIKAPFNKTFTIKATDEGKPPKSTEVPVTITVQTAIELEQRKLEKSSEDEEEAHPAVFSQHVYFADYTDNHILKIEPIVIKYGAQKNTILKQKGYEQYFEVEMKNADHNEVIVEKLQDLPQDILDHMDIITIEIEAINEDVHFPGRTALLIRLPKLGQISNNFEGEKEYNTNVVYGYDANGALGPLLLFAVGVCSIIFINTYIIILFVKKQSQNEKA